ncbi:MAG: ABC transporter ATP-binding protein [Rubrivivax sp.]
MSDSPDHATSAARTFLELQDLVKTYDGFQAVDQVSLDIAQGEIFALLGPSGCGKSTLLRLLAGFEAPTSGRVLLDGQDLVDLAPYQRPMNMMFQSYALFPHLSVANNIAFGPRRDGLPRAAVSERVDAMLKLVQLESFAKRKPHQLSGGQQQRVALARCLARQPRMLLLDEPLGALDKKLREQTQIELVAIIREVGVTCVIVTHDQEEAMTMASRIGVMNQGRLLQVDTPVAIYETPATRFVAEFIGNVNLIERGGRTVALRPEKIGLSREKPVGTDASSVVLTEGGCLRGTIRTSAYFGSHTVFHLDIDGGSALKASVANSARHHDHDYRQGDAVWAHWSADAQMELGA